MSGLTITNLSKKFAARGTTTVAIDDVSLTIADGELLVLLGPSGCGKTTTLRALAGLETPDAGRIQFGDRIVFDAAQKLDIKSNRRDIGMVFQSYALWPHMTVRKNIAYPLKSRLKGHGIKEGWVDEVAELVGCGSLLERYPSQLSGGQQQRVALARALVARPKILLFDEPLSNLDARLRAQLRVDLHRLHQQLKFTGVYVTHDQDEALALGDRLAIMRAGRIEQLDSPAAVFAKPKTEDVASFMGIDNVVELKKGAGGWACDMGELLGALPKLGESVQRLRVRREDVKIYRSATEMHEREMGISGAIVTDVSFAGRRRTVALDLAGFSLVADLDSHSEPLNPSDVVVVAFDIESAIVFGDSNIGSASNEVVTTGLAAASGSA